VDFGVCILAVKKKKSGQVLACRIGPFPCQSEFKLVIGASCEECFREEKIYV
jgi:hypothetical protein